MSINILAMVNPTAINGTSLPDVRMGISNHSDSHLVIVIISLYRAVWSAVQLECPRPELGTG